MKAQREHRPAHGIMIRALLIAVVVLSPLQSADAKSASVDPALCDALVKNTPNPDVAYQPGVDVEGNAVAPADLPGSPTLKLPKKINIPLALNLAKTLNLNTSSYPYNKFGQGTEAEIGVITLDGDEVSFNGQPLSEDQQDKLAVLCMQAK